MSNQDPSPGWANGRGFEAAVRWCLAGLRFAKNASPPPCEVHPFDRLHGVDTSGLLYADKLASGHAHDVSSEGYYATAPSLFHGALGCWQATLSGHVLQDYSFIDLGCGKGRVLFMASGYPFRKITGVELSGRLVKVARRNLATWLRRRHACPRISIQQGDVMHLILPANPVVLFLFNSFGAPVMTELVEGLAAAAKVRSTPIDLVYVHPEHEVLVCQAPGFELLADEEILFSAEDAAADAFEVSNDRCTIFRLRAFA